MTKNVWGVLLALFALFLAWLYVTGRLQNVWASVQGQAPSVQQQSGGTTNTQSEAPNVTPIPQIGGTYNGSSIIPAAMITTTQEPNTSTNPGNTIWGLLQTTPQSLNNGQESIGVQPGVTINYTNPLNTNLQGMYYSLANPNPNGPLSGLAQQIQNGLGFGGGSGESVIEYDPATGQDIQPYTNIYSTPSISPSQLENYGLGTGTDNPSNSDITYA